VVEVRGRAYIGVPSCVLLSDRDRLPRTRVHPMARLIPVLMATLLVASRPLAGQEGSETSKKLCALLRPADLTALFTTSDISPGWGAGNRCTWGAQSVKHGNIRPLASGGVYLIGGVGYYMKLDITLTEPKKGETAEQSFVHLRQNAMAGGRHPTDETGIGDRAYSYTVTPVNAGAIDHAGPIRPYPEPRASFLVYTKGRILSFNAYGTSDRDALRTVVKTAVAAYSA
jgi:hypothetical protein